MTSIWVLDPSLESKWNAYVAASPHATLFHELAWRDLLTSAFRHRPHYVVAEHRGSIVGVLPLFEIRSMFFGTSLVSVPFGVYGGILADNADAAARLAEHGRGVAERAGASYVELRQLHPSGLDLPGSDLYVTFIGEVPSGRDACLERIPRKARAEVRKAIAREGLSVDVHSKDVPEFHRLFGENKRKLGSPVFPESLFWRVQEHLKDDAFILRVRHDGETVAAVFSFIHRQTIMPYYSGATERAQAVSANNLMYFALMEEAGRRGLRHFDFGRSRRDTGSFAFKKNQGFEPTPLPYQYLLGPGARVPAVNPDNPKYNLARALFRRVPAPLAAKLGSFVTKRMPV
jgi:FemAB-related protein (PEP-CTERM system-associated)